MILFFPGIESSKELNSFEIKTFANIINAFTVTFD